MAEQSKKTYATGDTLSILRGTTEEQETRKQYVPEGMNSLLSGSAVSDESWYDDPKMAAMMFLDGVVFGFSDEMAAAASAFSKRLSGSTESYDSLYTKTVMEMEAERAAYQEKFPEASLALNVAGGLALTPFGGTIARGATSLASRAAAAAPTATKAISQVASGVPSSVSNVLSKGTVAAPFAEMAAIGGLSGIGYAQQGADLGEAALDGMISALQTGVALKAVGTTARIASDQRVSRKLRTEEGFKGLSMSEDGAALENIYKGVVKDLPFARGLIDQQNKKYIAPFESRVANGQARLNLIKETSGMTKYIKDQEDFSAAALKKNEEFQLKGIKEAAANAEAKIIDRRNVALLARTQKLNQAVIDAENEFRKKAFTLSLPASISKKTQDSILSKKNVNEAFSELSENWTTKGFEVVNNRSFRINTTQFTNQLQSRVAKELDDAFDLYGLSKKDIDTAIASFITRNTNPQGWISGKDISSLRNKVSAKVGSFDNARQAGISLLNKKILDQVNDVIRSSLKKPSEIAKFESDLKNYKHFVSLRDAVAASSRKGAKGAFSGSEWLSSLSKNLGTRQFASGKGVLYKEANELNEYTSKVDALTKKAAQSSARLQKAKIASAVGVLEGEAKSLAKKQTEAQLNGMDDIVQQYNSIQAKLTRDSEQLKKVKELMPSTSPNDGRFSYIYGSMVGLGGALTGGGIGGILGIASLAPVGKFLGSETGQLILAGQTQAQKSIAKGLDRIQPVASAVSRSAQIESARQDAEALDLSEKMRIARTGTASAKAALYRQLAAKGELQNFKKSSGEYFNVIEAAWKSQQQ
jgi:hypothetical protein